MKKRLGAEVGLIPSGGGVFEIMVDGKLVYSKKSTGEFPDEETLLKGLGG